MPTKADMLREATTAIDYFLRQNRYKREGAVRHCFHGQGNSADEFFASFDCMASRGRTKAEKGYRVADKVVLWGGPAVGVATLGAGMGGVPTSITPDGGSGMGNGTLGFGPQHVVGVAGAIRKLVDKDYRKEHKELKEHPAVRQQSLRKQNRLCRCVARFTVCTTDLPDGVLTDLNGGTVPGGKGMFNLVAVNVGICRLPSSGGPAADFPHPEQGMPMGATQAVFTVRNQPLDRSEQCLDIRVLRPGQAPPANVGPSIVPVLPFRGFMR